MVPVVASRVLALVILAAATPDASATPSAPVVPAGPRPPTASAALRATTGPAARNESTIAASLAAVGDVMLGRGLDRTIAAQGTAYPFARVRDILRKTDLAFANLECVLGAGGQPRAKRAVLRAHPSAAAALSDAGFTLLDLANNHSLDFGDVALSETLDILSSAGLAIVGAGRKSDDAYRPVFIERGGITFAFVAYSVNAEESLSLPAGTVALATPKSVAAGVSAAHRRADFTVALFHWGFEDAHEPTDRQVEYAHLAIDSGAQLVIGSHPHVLQPLEAYHDGIIAYSLGNFVFDSEELDRRRSVILRATVRRNRAPELELVPIVLVDGRPQPADPAQARGIADLLQGLSQPRGIRLRARPDGVLHPQVVEHEQPGSTTANVDSTGTETVTHDRQ